MTEDVHPAKLAVDQLRIVARRGAEEGRRIVDAVSFSVPEGGVFTVVGPSGSGKSTLLRGIVRLVEPDVGRVLLDGGDVTALPVTELRRRVGMVFQRPAMFEGTVTDNVLYGPRLRREHPERDGPGARDAAVPLLERVGLPADFAGKPADELSGGEAQRVALARALANRPEVLLLDEPTSSLDPTASRCIEELLAALAESTDLTFVFVTHDLHQARRIGDQGLLLVEGQVVERGPLPAMLDDPAHDLTRLFATGQLGGRRRESPRDQSPAADAGPDASPAADAGPDGEGRLP